MKKNKHRRPTVAQHKERRREKLNGHRSREMVFEKELDETKLKQFKQYFEQKRIKIHSLVLSFFKVSADSYASKFRVTIEKRIPKHRLFELVEPQFPQGCNITFHFKYRFTHTFDVKTTLPMTYNEFAWRICEALEKNL